MKMKQYRVYRLNSNIKELWQQYPEIKAKITKLEPKNSFFDRQMECFFQTNEGISDYIEDKLKKRSDYSRDKNRHYLHNKLTNENLVCIVDDYYITIKANKKENIFLEILFNIDNSLEKTYVCEVSN